ncbi:MAG: ribonuclease R [Lachnospiraceae bacterium]
MEKLTLEERKKIVYDFICSELYIPMKQKELAIILQIPRENRTVLEEALQALLAEDKIEVSKRGKYEKSEGKRLVGIFEGHPRGFGFVTIEGQDEDIFISESNTGGAFHLDRVEIALLAPSGGKRREGVVVKVLERNNKQLVGIYEKSKNFGFVKPDNQRIGQDIFVSKGQSMDAVSGHKVLVELTGFGDKNHKPEGRVIELLGHVNDPGTDILSIVRGYGLDTEFPEDVLTQIEIIADEVPENEKKGRLDLRQVPMVTIDGEDAKDLDDAVSLTKKDGLYYLGVHIADVSNYVPEGSLLDEEALKRGTSVYLVDRVIPMLPQKLSNGICSLNAGSDRLALSCLMTIDENGIVRDHTIAESVICVDERMTYTSVMKILTDKDEMECETYEEFVPMFQQMEELAGLLRENRKQRGSIDFDFPETKVILDERGKPIDIKPYDRNVATKMIEDFMLVANETVAEDYFWQELPFLYRTHDKPDPEKIVKLGLFIQNFGYRIKGGKEEIHPKELQKLLTNIEGTQEEALISRLTLRSMKQAHYTPLNTGHFGLAAQYYCHFTSPIRRYPDLQIHRIIKESLRGKLSSSRIAHFEKILPEVAKQTSDRERKADEAERETIKLKKVEYMQARIGEIFEGVVSGVTNWGLYVELPNTIEGMVHVTSLKDDYYEFSEDTYELIGKAKNRHYKLGQTVKVIVKGTDRLMRTIDFELLEG